MPPNPNPYEQFGKSLVLALELPITYEDGTEEKIGADETFTVRKHPIVMSNVYGSETMKGILVQKDWCNPEFDASDWNRAVVIPAMEEPKGELVV